jgi:hypothetical protein
MEVNESLSTVDRLVRIDGSGSFVAIDSWRYRPRDRRTSFRPGDIVKVEVPTREHLQDYVDRVFVGDLREEWLWSNYNFGARGY